MDSTTGAETRQNGALEVSGSVSSEFAGEGQSGAEVASSQLVTQTEAVPNTNSGENCEKEHLQTSNTTGKF